MLLNREGDLNEDDDGDGADGGDDVDDSDGDGDDVDDDNVRRPAVNVQVDVRPDWSFGRACKASKAPSKAKIRVSSSTKVAKWNI